MSNGLFDFYWTEPFVRTQTCDFFTQIYTHTGQYSSIPFLIWSLNCFTLHASKKRAAGWSQSFFFKGFNKNAILNCFHLYWMAHSENRDDETRLTRVTDHDNVSTCDVEIYCPACGNLSAASCVLCMMVESRNVSDFTAAISLIGCDKAPHKEPWPPAEVDSLLDQPSGVCCSTDPLWG